MGQKILYTGVFLAIAVLLVLGYLVMQEQKDTDIKTFEECVDAGGPILESYPRQCVYEGESFTEVISETATADEDTAVEVETTINPVEKEGTVHNLGELLCKCFMIQLDDGTTRDVRYGDFLEDGKENISMEGIENGDRVKITGTEEIDPGASVQPEIQLEEITIL